MYTKRLILFSLLFALLGSATWAQQSSKSKSKEVIYEKPGEIAQVDVRNTTSLNSPNTDFSPAFYQNGLVYVSSKRKNGPRDKKTNETYFELYFSPFDPNGDPTSAEQFSLQINSSKHEGPVSFSRDWKTIYFTRNNMENGVRKADHDGVVHLKIFEAQRGVFDWMDVRELPFNSDNFSCMHPSLSADGKTLYFSSDMPGGQGGFDLYKSTRTNTGWSTPQNLGSEINTDKNEVFPFIHTAGDLFFSTSGHNSYGGLDIFVAKPEGSNWEVANLGKPFNTAADDLGIIMNDEADRGFFSSSRDNGYGKDDIYSFRIRGGIPVVAPLEIRRLTVKVLDPKGTPIQGAAIRVLMPETGGYVSGRNDFYKLDLVPLDDNSNEVTMKLVRKNASDLGPADLFTNASGDAYWDFKPYTNYLLIADLPGYKAAERMFSLESVEGNEVTLRLQNAPRCATVTGVVAHEQFGKRIANCVVRFTNKATSKQTTGRTDMNGEFELCLDESGTYLYHFEKPGFKNDDNTIEVAVGKEQHLEARLQPKPMMGSTASNLTMDGPIREGSRINIDDIYYDYNKATLNESGVKHMEGLLQLLLSYPTMEIDLVSHTDARGLEDVNLALSTKRAEYAKNYLVYRGVKAHRINSYGKGESEIRNRCAEGVNCSEEEHAQNRRTEIIVRKLGK